MPLRDDEIEKKVMLLKLLLKEEDETIDDMLKALANTGMFDLQRAKELYSELERDGYIKDGSLTFIGDAEARKAKEEFTLAN